MRCSSWPARGHPVPPWAGRLMACLMGKVTTVCPLTFPASAGSFEKSALHDTTGMSLALRLPAGRAGAGREGRGAGALASRLAWRRRRQGCQGACRRGRCLAGTGLAHQAGSSPCSGLAAQPELCYIAQAQTRNTCRRTPPGRWGPDRSRGSLAQRPARPGPSGCQEISGRPVEQARAQEGGEGCQGPCWGPHALRLACRGAPPLHASGRRYLATAGTGPNAQHACKPSAGLGRRPRMPHPVPRPATSAGSPASRSAPAGRTQCPRWSP